MSLSTILKDPTFWKGDIANNLLDHIYTQQLSEAQRELLLAFSAYTAYRRHPTTDRSGLAILSS